MAVSALCVASSLTLTDLLASIVDCAAFNSLCSATAAQRRAEIEPDVCAGAGRNFLLGLVDLGLQAL